ncbi:MAG: nitroreductase family protein [Pseudomonadota bacterium]
MADTSLQDLFNARFGDVGATDIQNPVLTQMAGRGSCRAFTDTAVSPDLLRVLYGAALSSPTKSDLQQRDIVELRSQSTRRQLAALIPGQAWVAEAPIVLVFCGNNRRQRLIHDWHGIPFANDHFDAAFNAIADAAIALGAFVTAAEAVGLGCCPISAVRNEAQAVSDMLGLPDHVFPFAGLAVGYPAQKPKVSMRLPLGVACHVDRYDESGLRETVEAYDAARTAHQPYAAQKFANRFGEAKDYGWSEDKARQYSASERADFGAFIRDKGFDLS